MVGDVRATAYPNEAGKGNGGLPATFHAMMRVDRAGTGAEIKRIFRARISSMEPLFEIVELRESRMETNKDGVAPLF